ncbi:MAG: ribonuclease H family protein [Agathobacter sp.]|nr:ribonuclease H family protein [Agathobacter sp.]
MAKKYYAVRVGKTPGIYLSWDDCKAMVDGYPGAKYKSFGSIAEAEAFLEGIEYVQLEQEACMIQETTSAKTNAGTYAFVDGSYNVTTGVYGYGGFLVVDGEKHILQGSGNEEEMATMRNVAGEILGSMAAVEKAIELGLKELVIYYDYMGIEMWATGGWKRNKAGTIAYYEFMQRVRNQITITFQKVKGHSGVAGNEEADRLAKEAVGIEG